MCPLSLVEKEGDIRHVSNWKEGKDCYACQCSLKKSLKSCAEKQWRWTDKRQMQLQDRHDGDARFSEIRGKIVFQGSWPNRSVYTGRGQTFFFKSFSLCYGSRRARCEREQEPDLRLNHLWLFWSCIAMIQSYQEKLRKNRKRELNYLIYSFDLSPWQKEHWIREEGVNNPKNICLFKNKLTKSPNNTHLPLSKKTPKPSSKTPQPMSWNSGSLWLRGCWAVLDTKEGEMTLSSCSSTPGSHKLPEHINHFWSSKVLVAGQKTLFSVHGCYRLVQIYPTFCEFQYLRAWHTTHLVQKLFLSIKTFSLDLSVPQSCDWRVADGTSDQLACHVWLTERIIFVLTQALAPDTFWNHRKLWLQLWWSACVSQVAVEVTPTIQWEKYRIFFFLL